MLDEKEKQIYKNMKASKVMDEYKCNTKKDVDDKVKEAQDEKEGKPKGGKNG